MTTLFSSINRIWTSSESYVAVDWFHLQRSAAMPPSTAIPRSWGPLLARRLGVYGTIRRIYGAPGLTSMRCSGAIWRWYQAMMNELRSVPALMWTLVCSPVHLLLLRPVTNSAAYCSTLRGYQTSCGSFTVGAGRTVNIKAVAGKPRDAACYLFLYLKQIISVVCTLTSSIQHQFLFKSTFTFAPNFSNMYY